MTFIIIAPPKIRILDNNFKIIHEEDLHTKEYVESIINDSSFNQLEELKKRFNARIANIKQRKRYYEIYNYDFNVLRDLGFDYSLAMTNNSLSIDRMIILLSNLLEELQKSKNILGVKLHDFFLLVAPLYVNSSLDKMIKIFIDKGLKGVISEFNGFSFDSLFMVEDVYLSIAKQYVELSHREFEVKKKIDELMNKCCKNLFFLTKRLGAKLLRQAGSLKSLAEMPSSTIQLLGAEKALFRHLTTGAKSPKYGYLLQHPLVAKSKNKGKAARILAELISLAVRIDYFSKRDATKELQELLDKKFKSIK